MTTYAFETITPTQALSFGAGDSLTLPTGASAKTTTILYLADGTYSMAIGDRAVVFGTFFRENVDRIRFPDQSTLFVGSATSETRNAGEFASTGAMYGGDGGDTLTAGKGDWLLQGNQGDDRISAWSLGANTIYGGQGSDYVSMISGGPDPIRAQFIQGNKGNDTIQGESAADTLLGGQGDDYIHGGGFGADFLNGNLGDDELQGSGQLFGEGGNDYIRVFPGAPSTASGGDGEDYIQLGSDGREGRNVALGGAGNDTIGGHSTNRDLLDGGEGADLIAIIRHDATQAVGGSGLAGGSGNDTMRASDGNDTINGEAGADVMSGGAGRDIFVLQNRPVSNTNGDIDRILDWSVEDRIDLIGPVIRYVEVGSPDLASAHSFAKSTFGDGVVDLVVILIPDGVAIFSRSFEVGNQGAVDTAALLVGRTLADISIDNFV